MCKGGRSFAHITSNGDVFPCSNCAMENIFIAGNIRENSLLNIWNNSFKDMRKIQYSDFEKCKELKFLENVHGDAHIKNLKKIKKNGKKEFVSGKPLWYSKIK